MASSDHVAISSTAGHVEKLKLSRKMVGENDAIAAVKSGDPNFDSELSNGFQKLIAEAKNRQKRKVEDTSNDAQQTSGEAPIRIISANCWRALFCALYSCYICYVLRT